MTRFTERLAAAWRWQTSQIRNGLLVQPSNLRAVFEQLHLKRLLHYLDVDCVFDVGANAGQYARMLRRNAKFEGRIISFEPIPALAEQIRQAASADDRWSVEEIAIATESSTVKFNVMAENQFSSLTAPKHDETTLFSKKNVVTEQIDVRSESLENAYFRLKEKYGFERPFLKLDTQGFDVAIVEAGKSVLPNFLGLQSELAVKKLYQTSVDFREALTLYQDMGFALSALVPNNAGHFPDLIELDCIMIRSDLMPDGR